MRSYGTTRRRFVHSILFALMMVIAVVVLLAFVLSREPKRMASPILIESGMVQGETQAGVTSYKGIPYAAPPTGEFRWRAPQPMTNWSGILRTTEFKSACMQVRLATPGLAVQSISEDCLYLNIWTPAKSGAEKIPVMVFLHGGGGVTGSGAQRLYWGGEFAKKGVVFVTLNSRLGSFGALANAELTKESGYNASGNYSLLDDIAALQWVQRNISSFGGDPHNVTLFGHSAGAYQASQLMVSPLARGLFAHVIAESGGDFGPNDFPSLSQAEMRGAVYQERLGAHTIAELRAIPAQKILVADSQSQDANGLPHAQNIPNIDGYVIPKNPSEIFAEGKAQPVDLLVGYTTDEGANTVGTPLRAEKYIARAHAVYGILADKFIALFPARSDAEAALSQVRVHNSDTAWRMVIWAQLHSRTRNKVFLYNFSRVPPFQPFRRLGAAGHGAELPYVFGYPASIFFFALETPWKAYRDMRLANAMQSYWTNFAKTGDPNGAGLPRWPTYNEAKQIMDFGENLEVGDLPGQKEIALIDEYMARLRRQNNDSFDPASRVPITCCGPMRQ